MTEKARISGKVAQILNSRELVLNVGADAGVTLGMSFDVLDTKGEEIEDPDTGEVLGSLRRSKVRVEVSRVEDRMSVARTYRKSRINVGGNMPEITHFSRAFLPPKWITKYETLKTDEKTWEQLEERESYVNTGDPVIQVLPDTQVDIDEDATQ